MGYSTGHRYFDISTWQMGTFYIACHHRAPDKYFFRPPVGPYFESTNLDEAIARLQSALVRDREQEFEDSTREGCGDFIKNTTKFSVAALKSPCRQCLSEMQQQLNRLSSVIAWLLELPQEWDCVCDTELLKDNEESALPLLKATIGSESAAPPGCDAPLKNRPGDGL